jgi:hypothetical protein
MRSAMPDNDLQLNDLQLNDLQLIGIREMVPGVGIEPTLLSEPDFESGASTNFTTRAVFRSGGRLPSFRLFRRLGDKSGNYP